MLQLQPMLSLLELESIECSSLLRLNFQLQKSLIKYLLGKAYVFIQIFRFIKVMADIHLQQLEEFLYFENKIKLWN